MASVSGVGERLALIAGGALALALIQLLRAKREAERSSKGGMTAALGTTTEVHTYLLYRRSVQQQ